MFKLAPAKPSDLPWLFALHKVALKAYVEQIWGWDEAWQRHYFYSSLKLEVTWLIVTENKPVGRLTVEDKSDHIFLSYIALLPSHQNKGIGTAVIRSIMREANQTGKPLRLSVLRPNPAKALYERLGFVVTGEDEIRSTLSYG